MFSCGVLVHAPIARRPSVRARRMNRAGSPRPDALRPPPPGFSCARNHDGRRTPRGLKGTGRRRRRGQKNWGKLGNHKKPKSERKQCYEAWQPGACVPELQREGQAGELQCAHMSRVPPTELRGVPHQAGEWRVLL